MKDSRAVLVVDDDAAMRDACRQVLERAGYAVEEAADGPAALEKAARTAFDLALLDLRLPGMGGLEVLGRVREASPETPVVILTGFATLESAVDAMRLGASDYLPKPFTPEALRAVAERVLQGRRLRRENEYLRGELARVGGEDRIVGESAVIREVLDLIRRVAATDCTVLIAGESGTGKELFARALHEQSLRAQGPFIVVDCCTLVGSLFESEIFGHVKGSFTGASATTHGRLELANGGTLFFDEVGNVSLEMQAKLLRVIQEREFTRVGGHQAVKVDVRLVAATNSDLLELVRKGSFREDLYYRLCVVPVTVPPLRRRKEDIPLLVDHFIRKYNRERGKGIRGIHGDALQALLGHDWPGNVRELENTVERAVILAAGDVIMPGELLQYACKTLPPPPPPPAGRSRSLEEMEAEHIRSTLREVKGSRGEAAERLGIHRKTLWRKMKRYGIEGGRE